MAKKKTGQGSTTLSLQDQVERRLTECMTQTGYSDELIRKAVHGWRWFYTQELPNIRSVDGYAAALEYAVMYILSMESSITQREVAERYGTTVATVSRLSNQMISRWAADAQEEDKTQQDQGHEKQKGATIHVLPKQRSKGQMQQETSPNQQDQQDQQGQQDEWIPQAVMESLLNLPQVQEHWVGGRKGLRFYVEEPHLYRPDLVLWADIGGYPVIGHMIVKPEDNESIALFACIQAMLSPEHGAPRRPKRITVSKESWLEPFRQCLQPLQIEVKSGNGQVIDAIATLMNSQFQEREFATLPSFTAGGKIPAEDVAAFFRACARFYEVTPWRFLNNVDTLAIRLDRWEWQTATVSVMGAGGMEFGMLMFRSAQDCFAMELIHHMLPYVSPKDMDIPMPDMLAMDFARGGDLEPALRQEVFKHGWEVVHTDAYPMLRVVESLQYVKPIQQEDYHIATAIIHAVTVFVQTNQSRLHKNAKKTIETTVPFPQDPEAPPMVVTYPNAAYRELQKLRR